MSKYKEPIFTKEELDEKISGVKFGYSSHEKVPSEYLGVLSESTNSGTCSTNNDDSCYLVPGYDFRPKYAGAFLKALDKAEELINGMAKKREICAKINSFGWATLNGSVLRFGLKYSSPNGLSKVGKSAVEKYNQLLGFYLEQVGWKNIKRDDFDNYEIPLDYSENVELLYKLSPSIGFYYKSDRPDMKNFEQWRYEASYKDSQRKAMRKLNEEYNMNK